MRYIARYYNYIDRNQGTYSFYSSLRPSDLEMNITSEYCLQDGYVTYLSENAALFVDKCAEMRKEGEEYEKFYLNVLEALSRGMIRAYAKERGNWFFELYHDEAE